MRVAVTNILWAGSNGVIFSAKTEEGRPVVVRHGEPLKPAPGEIYDVTGAEREYVDERGGRRRQIEADTVERASAAGALLGPWLRTLPGVGAERAGRLFDRFGAGLIEALGDPAQSAELTEALAPGRPHLGSKLAALLQARWVAMRAAEATALDEGSFYARLEEYGVTDRRAARSIYRLLGSTNSWAKLLEHPYAVAAVLDWRAADHVGVRLLRARGDVVDPLRHRDRLIGACDAAWRAILAGGSTAADAEEYAMRLGRLDVDAGEALELGIAARRAIRVAGVLRAPGAARLERAVAGELARLAAAPAAIEEWPLLVRRHEPQTHPLTDEQRRAVVEILKRPVAILQGGAGTGKTTTVRVVVDAWLGARGSIVLAALSGKAALRLSRSTGRLALTLARLLHGLERRAELESEGRPIPEDLPRVGRDTMLVVDESSMVDLATWSRVLARLPAGGRLVMVGDVAQLPPVGLGRVYHDLVEDGRLVSRLTRVMRQAEDNPIVAAAGLVRDGVVPTPPVYAGPERKGVFMVECPTGGIVEVVERLRAEMAGADGGDDVLVLAALNATCRGICKDMQEKREASGVPGARLGPLAPFVAIGDPVMATKNRYEEALMNGLLGRVESIDPVAIRFDGEEVARQVGRDALAELVSAWAITGHRAQGSEARRVIVALDGVHSMTREWLYTAITRATQQVVLVGAKSSLRAAVGRRTMRVTGFPFELAALERQETLK